MSRNDQADSRNFDAGTLLPNEGYCDQPYVVRLSDGTWVCVMTTGAGLEGESGQHVVSMRSTDQGRTWSQPVDIEPADGPESSWVMPLLLPDGRVFAFYTYNEDNLRTVTSDDGDIRRVDTLGAFCFKVSEDDGRSWSEQRYTIPVRRFQIDLENPYQGDIVFFWGVSKPMVLGGAAYVGFSKVGRFGNGFMARSEGAFLRSENVLTERDPARIIWETLPEGEVGLRAPAGPVADEHNLVGLDDGSLYCTYRTIDGWNCAAYSRDGGRSWTPPAYAEYSPGGRRIKHPRAANFVRRLSGGRFILWYHNNGTRWYNNDRTFGNRNVAWLVGGKERDGFIHWGTPEIVLYNDNFHRGSSYPDFVEEPDGSIAIVSTQKTDARVSWVDPELLAGLWSEESTVTPDELRIDAAEESAAAGASHPHGEIPSLFGPWRSNTFAPALNGRGGVSIEVAGRLGDIEPGTVIASNRDEAGTGIHITRGDAENIRIEISDGWATATWESDAGELVGGTDHHVVVTVDGGPKTIVFVVNGLVNDGGAARHYGWGRFFSEMKDISGAQSLSVGTDLTRLRLWARALRNAEAAAACREWRNR